MAKVQQRVNAQIEHVERADVLQKCKTTYLHKCNFRFALALGPQAIKRLEPGRRTPAFAGPPGITDFGALRRASHDPRYL